MLSGASLTAEEKEKLYKAIDYDENVRVKYPVEVREVERWACVLRQNFRILLWPLRYEVIHARVRSTPFHLL